MFRQWKHTNRIEIFIQIMTRYLFLILFFALFLGELSGQTIITDRPDQTESSSTVGKGNLQIESGILIGFEEEGTARERQILAPTTLFRIGVTKGLEIRVLNQFENAKNQVNSETINGISDLELGFKAQLLQKEDVNTEIAFLSHLIMPTGSTGLSLDKFGTINKLSISHSLTEDIGLGYNIGYNYFGEGKGDLTYSVALGIGITEKAAVYVEPYGDLVELENFVANFDAGATYLVNDDLQLDFSFGLGLNHKMNYMSLGVSWILKRD